MKKLIIISFPILIIYLIYLYIENSNKLEDKMFYVNNLSVVKTKNIKENIEEKKLGNTKTVKKTYKTSNWKTYNDSDNNKILKNNLENRRLLTEKFQKSKKDLKSSSKKINVIKNLTFVAKNREKFLRKRSVDYRNTEYRKHLLIQKERIATQRMVDELIKRQNK